MHVYCIIKYLSLPPPHKIKMSPSVIVILADLKYGFEVDYRQFSANIKNLKNLLLIIYLDYVRLQ